MGRTIPRQHDYYPFGLTFNSFQSLHSVDQRWKFQGQEHIDDLGLNWDSFKWRNHQPDIGRFFNVDLLAEKYVHNSPYAFSENKVTSHIELEGLEALRMPDAIGMVKQEVKKIENAVMPVVRETLEAIGIDLPVLKDGGGFVVESSTQVPMNSSDENVRKGDPDSKALDASPLLFPKLRNPFFDFVLGIESETHVIENSVNEEKEALPKYCNYCLIVNDTVVITEENKDEHFYEYYENWPGPKDENNEDKADDQD